VAASAARARRAVLSGGDAEREEQDTQVQSDLLYPWQLLRAGGNEQAHQPPGQSQTDAPPTNESSMLSVENCARCADGHAERNANGDFAALVTARESKKLATLAQAIRRTRPTTPRRHDEVWRTGPAESSRSGIKRTL